MRHHRCKLGHIINVVQGTLSITDTGKTIFTVKMEFSSGVYSVLVCQRNTSPCEERAEGGFTFEIRPSSKRLLLK